MGRSRREDRIRDYGRVYQEQYGFEHQQVAARRRFLVELVRRVRPKVVVEIGCGAELLAETVAESGMSPERWLVIEPISDFATLARDAARRLSFLEVVEGFVEDFSAQGLPVSSMPELVICSSLLHEVDEPAQILAACRRILSTGLGLLHVNVPNAGSLHRRLARAAGLIRDEHDMSARNVALHQRRVYDATSLQEEIRNADFTIEECGGYLIKPFAHAQMQKLSFLSPELLDGLYGLGRELPELASEIYAHARPRTH